MIIITAYKYDENIHHSPNHPNLGEVRSSRTKGCHRAYHQKRASKRVSSSTRTHQSHEKYLYPDKKIKKLSNIDVSEFIQKHNIKDQTSLLAIANNQKEQGKKDLVQYGFSHSSRNIDELIKQTCRMKGAAKVLDHQKASRMQLIRDACDGVWLRCAQEVLVNNKVHPILFAAAIRNLLTLGRGKYRNVMIVGVTNCEKTFLFKPPLS